MTVNRNTTIGLVGSGGDGVVLLGSLIQHLAAAAGYFGQMSKYYGAQIRGGGSAVKLNVNAAAPTLPGDVLDLLICFDWAKFAELQRELAVGRETLVLSETPPPDSITLPALALCVPFTKMAKDLTGDARNKNVLAFGMIAELLGFSPDFIAQVTEADKKFKVVRAKAPTLATGRKLVIDYGDTYPNRDALRLDPPVDPAPKMVVCGNEAVVEAAWTAGCSACFFYPITPATEISEMMGARMKAAGRGAFWQAEDEIAAVMNGFGGSLAGAKTIVATSGPGLSLMSEAISFGVGAEIPLVLVNVQRGGPSTGVPTKTEQSDLNLAVYGGHGDAPRIVLAPHDLESVWRLTREAFNLSEQYQVPVIVLSDQLVGQTYVALDGRFMAADYPVVDRLKPEADVAGQYKRYAKTSSDVSPMANFGDEGGVHQLSGLSHKEDGTHSPAQAVVQAWHDKLERKLVPLCYRDNLVRIYGNAKATDRIVTWGSSAQAVLAAVKKLGWSDRVAVCVPELISPLPDAVNWFADEAERLMVIELNHSAQFAHYLRSQTCVPRNFSTFCRSGAQPFGVDELVSAIRIRFSNIMDREEVQS